MRLLEKKVSEKMGEVVVSRIEIEETDTAHVVEKRGKFRTVTADGGGTTVDMEEASGSSSVVRWERFLPKMAVRVLLVEADDSTRQIIASLLRKCSYRVAAVTDGLEAWEVLKGSPCSIDLILTEIDLPSISGYALLTLIMEREACKNIPVIMMSSQDTVSTVYKCMLRGAADFLVKPVRRNELRNLWQHVWRKQASNPGVGFGRHPQESVQQKDENTAENNAISNYSSDYISCIRRNKLCTEKGSDDQISCTKPDSESVGKNIENGHCISKQQKANLSDNFNISCGQQSHQENREKRSHENVTREMPVMADTNAENAHTLENPCGEAIDLIGTFDNRRMGNLGRLPTNVIAKRFDILPLLDLSLRRPLHGGSENQTNNKQPRLNHSDASAFSRYRNKPSLPVSCNNRKEQETIPQTKFSNSALQNHITMPTIPTGSPHINKEISHPIPSKAVSYENANSAHNSTMPSTHYTPPHTESLPQSNLLYLPGHQPSSLQQNFDEKLSNSVVQVDDVEDWGMASCGNNDRSRNNNFSSNNRTHDQVHIRNDSSEHAGHEESLPAHDEASKRSMQREAALVKFRMKRKDRCFEKKIRYESRKKLAEQRPRVKGQFVRRSVE